MSSSAHTDRYLAPKRKQLAVFVHGFGSSAGCWTPLKEKLSADARVAQRMELECFEYPSKWFEFSFLRRVPSLRQVAHALIEFLERRRFDYDGFILVGHSQGG